MACNNMKVFTLGMMRIQFISLKDQFMACNKPLENGMKNLTKWSRLKDSKMIELITT